MKYKLLSNGKIEPIVYCGNCHKKMVLDDIDGRGKSLIYRMICEDDRCRSWCWIQYDKVIDYGICED